MNFRFFVEKKSQFAVEAQILWDDLKKTFNKNLDLSQLDSLRIINCYELHIEDPPEQINVQQIQNLAKEILSETNVDHFFEDLDVQQLASQGYQIIAFESLPGMFDQRADSARQIFLLSGADPNIKISYSKIVLLKSQSPISSSHLSQLANFLINPTELRSKDLRQFSLYLTNNQPQPTIVHHGFIKLSVEQLATFYQQQNMSINLVDLQYIQNYFITINRDPSEVELKIIDTYWSDHCRHTTFESKIDDVVFDPDIAKVFTESYVNYLEMRKLVYGDQEKNRKISLMDLATINAKYLRKIGQLNDLEISDEINACSIEVDVDFVDNSQEKWLLMFKNETHNHPTEIEPFGGAATCLGGAIRDPLSGRAYVYQAVRLSGAANPFTSIEDTLQGKLQQKVICQKAAAGFSSYGNQIGIATGLVNEVYHPNYVAKRLEVGAVVAAVPKSQIKRELPQEGDVIILIGGKTGRDGCGGATGSSKSHDSNSVSQCGSEVQKGNAPEERKIQRLFRDPEVTKLIKKCNDFGAGGVCVAIGELAAGLIIELDKIPTKYEGLSAVELAISESQERMAAVVSAQNCNKLLQKCDEYDVEATVVAQVTSEQNPTLKMYYKDQLVVDLQRDFLDSNGVLQQVKIKVAQPQLSNLHHNCHPISVVGFKEVLSDLNIASQKSLANLFDSTVGAATVHLPFAGNYYDTPSDVSIMKLPSLEKDTYTASAISWGFNPHLSEKSPFHGAAFAIIDSVSKLVASGAKLANIRLSLQEYFERLGDDPYRWGKPFIALLGAFTAMKALGLAAIGGKDSMSGTYDNRIDVPPTLISFAVASLDVRKVVSNEVKNSNDHLLLLTTKFDHNQLVDYDQLCANLSNLEKLIDQGLINSAIAGKQQGLFETLFKTLVGNRIGATINYELQQLFTSNYGSFVISCSDHNLTKVKNIVGEMAVYLGTTTTDDKLLFTDTINRQQVIATSINELYGDFNNKLKEIYPVRNQQEEQLLATEQASEIIYHYPIQQFNHQRLNLNIAKPKVIIATFLGTNCEYDCYRAFKDAGADPEIVLFKSLHIKHIEQSIHNLADKIKQANILMLPGGFSFGDEPEGSGKYIATVLKHPLISEAIHQLLSTDGLVLGSCNGFQALIKSGLLPYNQIGKVGEDSPTLTFNTNGKHISQIGNVKVISNKTPWLSNTELNQVYKVPMSHGEGRFVTTKEHFDLLLQQGQICTIYVDHNQQPTLAGNFNGSDFAIEGICSPDGKIYGKMGHVERYRAGLLQNAGEVSQHNIFLNGVNYFK